MYFYRFSGQISSTKCLNFGNFLKLVRIIVPFTYTILSILRWICLFLFDFLHFLALIRLVTSIQIITTILSWMRKIMLIHKFRELLRINWYYYTLLYFYRLSCQISPTKCLNFCNFLKFLWIRVIFIYCNLFIGCSWIFLVIWIFWLSIDWVCYTIIVFVIVVGWNCVNHFSTRLVLDIIITVFIGLSLGRSKSALILRNGIGIQICRRRTLRKLL